MSERRQAVGRAVATVALVGIGVLLVLMPSILRRRAQLPVVGTGFVFSDSAAPQPGAPPPDSAQVATALGSVIDPELNLSVVDMGLLESLRVDTCGNVRVGFVLTTPECPLYATIGHDALAAVRKLPGARRVVVRFDSDAAWDPSRMTDEGKRRYRETFGDSAGR